MKDLESEIRDILNGEIQFDEPMSAHTSLKIGGPADIMIFPEDPLSLQHVLRAADREGIPVSVFGAGTNLLVRDEGIKGIVISLKAFRNIENTKESDEVNTVLYAGSGVPLAGLITFAREKGYSGLEALAGIPGYVGGAVYMNAGSFGREIKDVVVSAAVMDRKGKITILGRDRIGFSYRKSNLPEGSIILGVNIVLKKDSPEAVKNRTREFLNRKKMAQPLGELSAGCVFRNPEGNAAGRFIESAGCKGMRIGAIEVSTLHANYFINKGGGTCKDFIDLMETVQQMVKKHSDVILEPEIRIMGREKEFSH